MFQNNVLAESCDYKFIYIDSVISSIVPKFIYLFLLMFLFFNRYLYLECVRIRTVGVR
jgi:hypothetical protein